MDAPAGLCYVTKSALNNDPLGRFWLGLLHLYGLSEEGTPVESLHLLWECVPIRSAAELEADVAFPSPTSFGCGTSPALKASLEAGTAACYCSSASCTVLTEGLRYVQQAAAAGLRAAQTRLGELFASGIIVVTLPPVSTSPLGAVPLSPERGHYQKSPGGASSSGGHSVSLWHQYIHSGSFCTGSATTTVLNQDATAALELFGKAAAQHCVRAHVHLARCYHLGLGAKIDHGEATRWHTRALLLHSEATSCA